VSLLPARPTVGWHRRVAAAAACAGLGVLVAVSGGGWPPYLSAAALGAGIVAASLLLAWSVDVAVTDLSGRLVIMAAAVVVALPELAVEVHLAFTRQAELVTANLTGATRLDVTAAVVIPAAGAMMLRSRGHTMPPPARHPARWQDLAMLATAALGALALAATGRLSLLAALIFGSVYVAYILRGQGADDEQPAALTGVAADIAVLPAGPRLKMSGALFAGGAVSVFMIATAFPDDLTRAGRGSGIAPYLLIQLIIPLFTEAPELVVAGTLMLHRRPAQSVGLLLAASLIQSTLALTSVSVAYLLGGGGLTLPLAGQARTELMLTAAITLAAVVALSPRKPHRIDGWIVTGAFGLQALFPGRPTHVFLALALLIYATDVLARPAYTRLRLLHAGPAGREAADARDPGAGP
jgi:cation:H+ antiporter